ncbi:MAG: VRR-NUC domain-containing protein [Vicinamibacterales bacterium]
MPPATWATLEAIQTRAGRVTGLGPDEFRSALESLKDDRSRLWKLPPFVHVPVIVGVLAKSGVLRKLLKRHGPEGEVNPKRPGIPDLFLWWEEDGRVVGARFVEVKVGKERLGPHQRAEIEFLRACGCKAGVVRLQVVKG